MHWRAPRFRHVYRRRFALVSVGGERSFVVKFGIIGRAMDTTMMRSIVTRSLVGLLAGLEEHMATGKEIDKGWKPSAAA